MIKQFAYAEICKLGANIPKMDKTQITWNEKYYKVEKNYKWVRVQQ